MASIMIQTIFSLTKVLDKKVMTGLEKREELFKTLKELLGETQFNEHKEIINYILETLIFISKTHKVLGLNEKSFSNNCCK